MKIKILISLMISLSVFYLSATTIYDIQYTENAGDGTYPSPMDGEDVTVTGIVTAIDYYSSGAEYFFISEPEGGAWRGVYIYQTDDNLEIGDEVEVSGTVSEYYGFTEIGYASFTVLSSDNPIPEPVQITTNQLANEEKYEGVLVEINNVIITQEDDSYGQWYVNDGSSEAQIDDHIYEYPNIAEGNEIYSITGVVDYSFDEYGLNPRSEYDIIETNEDTTPPEIENAEALSTTLVELEYSEEVEETTAEDIENYTINNLTIESITLQDNDKTVDIITTEQTPDEVYTITISNVQDLAGNNIETDSQTEFTGYQGDITPPQIISAEALSSTTVELQYSESVETVTAENTNNYDISPLLIENIELQPDDETVIITTSEQTENETYTITVNNVEDLTGNTIEANSTIDFTGYYEEDIYTDIYDIQENIDTYDGETVTIKGIVTIGVNIVQTGNTNAYVQDESGRGINIFDYDPISELVRGNEVEITGEVEDYIDGYGNPTTEIKEPQVILLSENNEIPEPLEIDFDDINDLSLEGTLLQITGEIYEVYYAGGGTNINIKNDANQQMTIRIWDSTNLDLEEFTEGYILQAIGVGSSYSQKLQIVPGYQDQLSEGSMQEFDFYSISDTINADSSVPITFYPPDDISLQSVELFWKLSDDLNFDISSMTEYPGESVWKDTLSKQPESSVVQFFFRTTAADSLETVSFYPGGAPDSLISYTVPLTYHKAVLNIPPKPFDPYHGETFNIEFGSEYNNKAILRLYNTEGKLVTTLFNDITSETDGIINYIWDGRDKHNNLVKLGLYICYLEVIETETGKKKTATAPIMVGTELK